MGESRWVPGKDLISIHITNVKVKHIQRNFFIPESSCYFHHLFVRGIAPSRLLKAQPPYWRHLYPTCQKTVFFQDAGWCVMIEKNSNLPGHLPPRSS